MDRVACCRRAAREAVADVEPPRLHDALVDGIDDASMTPGVLTLTSAATADPEANLEDAVAPRAAGVQLIYEGLRLTRQLAHDEPWAAHDRGVDDGETDDGIHGTSDESALGNADEDRARRTDADVAILAADILVARGFYLLARTDAADTAVETVRAFGRDQTRRQEPDADVASLDTQLERDVLELAVRAGAASVGEAPSSELLAYAAHVAEHVETGFPPAAQCLTTLDVAAHEHRPGDGLATDRATSASDH